MAGSGKTTFMQRIVSHLHTSPTNTTTNTSPPYVLNLDPAVRSVPFDSNIDIRDSVNYKEVMKQYNLGPNGGILTSLNLFATKIDQVMKILEARCLPPPPSTPSTSTSTPPPNAKPLPSHILIDTPGQIEVFVWSASGAILLDSLASAFPTVIAYIIDTPRSTANTSTFMSNMLYAISILYKTKLPMILVFNKTDVKSETEAVEWMRDFEAFQDALRKEEEETRQGEGGGYMGGLLNSMSLVLEEFYNALSVVGVSSMTGEGIPAFFEAVEGKRGEFERDYKPELERRRREAGAVKEEARKEDVGRMMRDMSVSSKVKGTGKYAGSGGKGGRGKKDEEPETVSDAEAMDEDEEDGTVDRDEDEDVERDEEDGEGGFEQGLQGRYQAALQPERGTGGGGGVKGVAEHILKTQR